MKPPPLNFNLNQSGLKRVLSQNSKTFICHQLVLFNFKQEQCTTKQQRFFFIFLTCILISRCVSQTRMNLTSPEANRLPVSCSQLITKPDPLPETSETSIKRAKSTSRSTLNSLHQFFSPVNSLNSETEVAHHCSPCVEERILNRNSFRSTLNRLTGVFA